MGGWFKSKSSKGDASAPAASTPPYEVGEFSIKHGISIIEARRILRETGQSRDEADAAAESAGEASVTTSPDPTSILIGGIAMVEVTDSNIRSGRR